MEDGLRRRAGFGGGIVNDSLFQAGSEMPTAQLLRAGRLVLAGSAPRTGRIRFVHRGGWALVNRENACEPCERMSAGEPDKGPQWFSSDTIAPPYRSTAARIAATTASSCSGNT